ncbi:TlpA family protein disulfide reductase [Candidatus Wolfebacteria bacterium]|nr:TlpA family protein disulfide reductase [Candidatus Wolfebacteria bacterium]
MNRYIVGGIGLIIIVAGVLFFSASDRSVDTKADKSDFDTFASASLIGYNGNKVSLEEFRGRPLVINSWAVWCPFCRNELRDFAELQKEFKNEITVIAIDRQEPFAKAKGYTDELGITNDMLFLLDPSDSFYKSIGGFSMPETIFVDSGGSIIVHKRGPMELDEMREHTNKIISATEDSV